MNKRIRMMMKAMPCFIADKFFATKDKTQIPLCDFILMLRKGAFNRGLHRLNQIHCGQCV